MSTARVEAVQARRHFAGEGLKDALLTFGQIVENRLKDGRFANEARDAKDAKSPEGGSAYQHVTRVSGLERPRHWELDLDALLNKLQL